MVSKLTPRPAEAKKKLEIAKPAPTRGAAPIKRVAAKDELSTGKGQRLRASAETALAATPFSAKPGAGAVAGTFRVNALGALAKTNAVAAAQFVPSAEDRMRVVTSPEDFAFQLGAEKDPAVRNEMIRIATTDKDYAFVFGPVGQAETINTGYDAQKTIAAAMDTAFRSGVITQSDVNGLVKNMGPEQAELFVTSTSIEGNSRALGGMVEAIGVASQAAGFDRAAALAFTTSESMIDKHLPGAAAQKAAFKHVESFLHEFDDRITGREGEPAGVRTAVEFALASAARLSARGNGFTDAQLDAELAKVGPRIVQETVARLGENSRFDDRAPGALDSLGDSAARLGKLDNKEAADFRVASALAYTQSPQLISQNLKDDAAKRAALETLNTFLAGRRDEYGDAAKDGYSLLRDPEAIDGVNRLLSSNPQLIGQLVNGGPAGEATLVQLMESISLNPDVPQAARDRFNDTVNTFIAKELARANEAPNVVGNEIGKLLGLIQVAGNRAVAAAEGPGKDATEEAVRGFVKGVTAGVVGLALSATGPVGSIVGGVIVGQVLDAVFADNTPDPTTAAIRKAFVEQLEAQGIDVSSGEAGQEAITNVLRATLDALNVALHDAPASEKAKIQEEINRLDQLITSIGIGFAGSVNSEGGAAGQLATELNGRNDEP